LLYAVKGSQERIGIKESYRKGWHKIGSYFWVAILAGFITIGGFLLLVIPGIIFVFWFILALIIVIAEDLKGMDALLKSKEYVRGRWGSVAWRVFFIGVISFLISLAFGFILSFLKIPYGEIVARLFNGLFLTPLGIIYLFLLYNNLKAIKGDFVFAPTKGQKAKFALIGLLGFLIIPAFFTLRSFLISRAINKNYEQSHLRGSAESIKGNMLGLRLQSGLYFDAKPLSYLGFCSSPPALSFQQMIESLGGKNFTCNDTTTAWAASVKLPSIGSGYWCVSSTEFSKEMDRSIVGTSCS